MTKKNISVGDVDVKPARKRPSRAEARARKAAKEAAATQAPADAAPSAPARPKGAPLAGPITVAAPQFRIAWHNARQARQRTRKGSRAAQSVHVEFYEDRVQLVGMHDALLLRAIVESTTAYIKEPWPTVPPYFTALILDDDGSFSNIVKAQAARQGSELTLTVKPTAVAKKDQLDGHEWSHDICVTANDGQVHVFPLLEEDPLAWRRFDPYGQLPIDSSSGSTISVALHNRLGALTGVSNIATEFLGPKRPLRVEGTHKDAVVLRGWVLPTAVDLADPSAADAQVLIDRLAASSKDPAGEEDGGEDPQVVDRPQLGMGDD